LWQPDRLEKERFRAHIQGMEKREKWTISPAIGGKVGVAYRLQNGRAGNAIIIVDTEEEAWKFIDSGRADELDQKGRK
jgi:hypothetical protein